MRYVDARDLSEQEICVLVAIIFAFIVSKRLLTSMSKSFLSQTKSFSQPCITFSFDGFEKKHSEKSSFMLLRRTIASMMKSVEAVESYIVHTKPTEEELQAREEELTTSSKYSTSTPKTVSESIDAINSNIEGESS